MLRERLKNNGFEKWSKYREVIVWDIMTKTEIVVEIYASLHIMRMKMILMVIAGVISNSVSWSLGWSESMQEITLGDCWYKLLCDIIPVWFSWNDWFLRLKGNQFYDRAISFQLRVEMIQKWRAENEKTKKRLQKAVRKNGQQITMSEWRQSSSRRPILMLRSFKTHCRWMISWFSIGAIISETNNGTSMKMIHTPFW
jgi:hypothetical protein